MESDVSSTKRWKLAWQKWNGGKVSWFVLDFVNLDASLVIGPGTVVECRNGERVTVRDVLTEDAILYVSGCPEGGGS